MDNQRNDKFKAMLGLVIIIVLGLVLISRNQ